MKISNLKCISTQLYISFKSAIYFTSVILLRFFSIYTNNHYYIIFSNSFYLLTNLLRFKHKATKNYKLYQLQYIYNLKFIYL